MKIQTAVLALLLGVSLVACPTSAPPPTLTNYAEIKATVDAPIAVGKTTITDGIAPIIYQADPANPLPTGITVNAVNGDISGKPKAIAAQKSYAIIARDGGGREARASVSITVNAGLTPPAPFSGIQATVGRPISGSLPAFTGGTLPRRVSVSPSLPAGLTLSFNDITGIAVISGTLTSAVPPTAYTVTLTDANGATIKQSFSLSLRPVLTFSYTTSTVTTALNVPISSGTGLPIHNATNVSSGGAVTYSITPSLPSGVTLNATTGLLSGTPTQVQAATTYTVTATNPADASYADSSAVAQFSLEVTASPIIAYPTGTLASTKGSAIPTVTATISGGVGPYTVSDVSATSLSSQNFSLQATGDITGGLNALQGTQTYTIRVTDSLGATSTANVTIQINASVAFTGTYSSLITTRGQASASVSSNAITGGTAPVAYSVSPAAPAWLTVSSTGVSAQPDAAAALGAVNYTVTATDSRGSSGSRQISVTVNDTPSLTLSRTIVAITAGQPSSETLTSSGSGGTSAYTYSLSNVDLASGFAEISIDSSGAVTIPANLAAPGNNLKKFKITLTDARGVTAEQTVTLVTNARPMLVLSSSTVAMTVGQTLNPTLTATGVNGTPAYTYSLVNVDLATGLTGISIDSSTGAVTITAASVAVIGNNGKSFKVVMVDSQTVTVEQTVTLTVNAAPTLSVSSNSVVLTAGQLGTASLTSSGSNGTAPYAYSLMDGNLGMALLNTITFSPTTGAITIPSSLANTANNAKAFKVRLTDARGVPSDQLITLTVNATPSFTISSSSVVMTAGQTVSIPNVTVASTSGGAANFTYSLTLPAGLTGITVDSSTGVVTIPSSVAATTANGGKTFNVVLTDANNVAVTKTVTLTVNAAPTLTISSNSAIMTAGQTAGVALTSSGAGGTTPYSYTLVNVSLVTGVTGINIDLNTGAVTITPSIAVIGNNAKSFKIRLTDARGVTAEQPFTLTVNAAPTLTLSSNAVGLTLTQTSSVALTSTGASGTGPYGYSLVNGNLTTGLTGISVDSSSGTVTIANTVAVAGNNGKTFNVVLTDSKNVTATQIVTLTVNAVPTLTISSNAVTMVAGQSSSVAVTVTAASGGTSAYVYSLANVSVVTDFSLISINATTGVVTIPGSVAVAANNAKAFKVRLTDVRGVIAEQTVTLTVTGSNLALSSSTYETTKTAVSQLALTYTTTGTGPFTVAQNGGTATGLTLVISAGNISIAASAGATSGTVILEARNTSNVLTGTATLSVTVNAVPTISPYVNTTINGLDGFNYIAINPGTGNLATPWSVVCTGSVPLAGALQSTPVVDAETGEILPAILVPDYAVGSTATCSVRYTDARGVQSAPDTWTITLVP